MYVTAIVLVAGKGTRLKTEVPKPLVRINSQPAIVYCLKLLGTYRYIKDILVVANLKNKEEILDTIKQYRINKIKTVVLGGKRRQDSVSKGLKAMDERTDFVLIHDGVRPFINKIMVSRVIAKAEKLGAAIMGVPVKATIKTARIRSSGPRRQFLVEETLDRNSLWEIQTPQVFRKDLILKAYDKFGHTPVTDDAMLVERLGAKVGLVLGSYDNIKITTPEDLIIAEAISKKWNTG